MNDGKSQTWFYYGSKVATQYDIDYIGKCDTDTLLHLDKYFEFVADNLPPSPYNRNILSGLFADKWWWGHDLHGEEQYHSTEKAIRAKYGGALHLYAQGQWYLMSPDLAAAAAKAARDTETSKLYLEHHEDHDVSTMAFVGAEKPVHVIIIGQFERFWTHGVKMSIKLEKFNKMWWKEMDRHRENVKKLFGDAYGNSSTSDKR